MIPIIIPIIQFMQVYDFLFHSVGCAFYQCKMTPNTHLPHRFYIICKLPQILIIGKLLVLFFSIAIHTSFYLGLYIHVFHGNLKKAIRYNLKQKPSQHKNKQKAHLQMSALSNLHHVGKTGEFPESPT